LDFVLPVAHAGHWLVYILYAVPVLIVLASIVVTVVRDRRRGEMDEERPTP
jgi:cytochrome c-type biogenesis protein CcmH/NrfF